MSIAPIYAFQKVLGFMANYSVMYAAHQAAKSKLRQNLLWALTCGVIALSWPTSVLAQSTTTSLTAAPNPSDVGEVVTLTATVTKTGGTFRGAADSIAAGSDHSCGITASGGVRCWGSNGYGELGRAGSASSVPVEVSGITNASKISSGTSHTCVVLSSGQIKCWGRNYGTSPVTVSGISTAIAIGAGVEHTCAVLADGSVNCWGNNSAGQLGDGTLIAKPTPVAVNGVSNAVQVVAGGNHSCALLSSGGVACWGYNDRGQLGDGTNIDKTSPVSVRDISNAVGLSAGFSHNCALLSSGEISCWGLNSNGQLGNGTTINASQPVTVSGLSYAVAVSAGNSHSCAVSLDGTAKCWGYNSSGQLGNGGTSSSLLPVDVVGMGLASWISAGSGQTCTVTSHGMAQCWGLNFSGQVGDGTNINRVLATEVADPITGSVSFSNGQTVLGSAAISGSTAVFSTSSLMTGNHNLSASYSGSFPSSTSALVNQTVKSSQTISWTQTLSGSVGANITLTATGGGSTSSVTYASITTSICTVSGSTLTLLAGGTCTVTASQSGDTNYSAATPVSRTFTVSPTSQIITWTQSLSGTALGSLSLTAYSSSGLAVSYASGTLGVCTITGSNLSFLTAGTCSLTASQVGNASYNAAASITRDFTVDPVAQTISWTQSLSGARGSNLALNATASSGLDVSYASSTTGVCTVSGSTLNFITGGSCSVTASQSGNAVYGAASPVTKTFDVDRSPQTISWEQSLSGVAGGSISLIATSSSGLAVSYASSTEDICTVSGSTLNLISAGDCVVTAMQTGDTSYAAAKSFRKALIIQATPKSTAISLSSSPNPSAFSQAVSLTATLSTASGTFDDSERVGKIAVGGAHTCAVVSGGAIRCWGLNRSGQLGIGSLTDSLLPVPVSGITSATFIAAGMEHTCAVLSNGTIQCWGKNDSGQLGNGSQINSATPTTVSGVSNAVAVATGPEHTCAVLSDGKVMCWGANSSRQLGNGTDPSPIPLIVDGISSAVAIAAGYQQSCAVLSGGEVKCWGNIVHGDPVYSITPVTISELSDALQVVVGQNHSCALLASGSVKCWGKAVLGNGTSDTSATPVLVTGITSAKSLSTSNSTNCVVLASGATSCWGDNINGSIGDGTKDSRLSPVGVLGIANTATVSAGGTHSCAILSGGNVRCWGLNSYGRLGDGTLVSSTIPVATSDPIVGTVSFYKGDTQLGTGTVSGGQATLSLTSLTRGNNALTASYEGTLPTSTSAVFVHAVQKVDQTISWTQSLSGSVENVITLTATASSGLPVSYVSSTTGTCTVSGSTLNLIAAGTCTVRASQSGSSDYYNAASDFPKTFTVTAGSQTITWVQSLSGSVEGSIGLTATTSSGLPVSYASSTTGICTVSGSTLTLVAAGSCTVTASQSGSSNYNAATPLPKTFTVTPGSQAISWGQPLSGSVEDIFTLAAVSTSGLPVSYTSSTTGICTVSGSTLTLVAAGSCTVTASQPGSSNYNAATPIPKTFTVTPGSQAISWGQPLSGSVEDTVNLTAVSTSGLPVSYDSSTTGICTVSGSTLNLIAAGSCTVTASQSGSSNYNAATPVPKTFTVTAGSQAIIWAQSLSGSVQGSIALTATTSSGLLVAYVSSTPGTCTVSGSTLNLIAAGSCTVTASQTGSSNYNAATPIAKTFIVTAGSQIITWSQSLSGGVGDTITLTASSSSGLPISYVSSTTNTCIINGSTLTLYATGACIVVASQAGTANFSAAEPLQRSFVVLGPNLSVVPSSLNFGSQLLNTPSNGQAVTLSNSGGGTVQINGISISGSDAGSFSASSNCGNLPAGVSCIVTVTFNPASLGAKVASLTVSSDAPGSPVVIGLSGSGSGTAPALSSSTNSLNFGDQPINASSSDQVIMLSNSGGGTIQIGGVSLSGTDAAMFSSTNNCSSLTAGASCAVTVTFRPTSLGAKVANLVISSDVAGSPSIIGLSGTGTAAAPMIALSPTALDFGSLATGKVGSTQTLTIRNLGSAPLKVGKIAVVGAQAKSFKGKGSCRTIAVNATCIVQVTFTPKTGGSHSATLTVNSDAYQAGVSTVPLSGVGVAPIPTINLSTTSLSFGNQAIGKTSSPLTITIGNSGTGPLKVGRMAISGAQSKSFKSKGSCKTVNVNATCAIQVTFTPKTGGAHSALLSITSNANQAPVVTVALSGVGASPSVALVAGYVDGPGHADGTGSEARFNAPVGLAIEPSGTLYVADSKNHVVRKITPDGMVSTVAGSPLIPGLSDGAKAVARFNSPTAVKVEAGAIVVGDSSGAIARKVDQSGIVVTLNDVTGSVIGASSSEASDAQQSVADPSNNVFLTDPSNSVIRRISNSGESTTVAGSVGLQGSSDGLGSEARFYSPVGIARASDNTLYVADALAHTIRKISPDGLVSTLAGVSATVGANDNVAHTATFRGPTGIVADAAGVLYVSDTDNNTVRRITPDGLVTTLAGSATSKGSVDGVGEDARFNGPSGLALDATGNLYVSDTGNHVVRRITPEGLVTTIAGRAGVSGAADGVGTSALFNGPSALAVTASGNLYIADTENFTVRKLTLSTGEVTTVAGAAGFTGSTNGVGPAARFGRINGIGVDSGGNVYVADFTHSTIRKITTSGSVTTFAGLPGVLGSRDGIGRSARFSGPRNLTVDNDNNLYVADYANCLLRKITSAAVVTTVAGTAGICKFTAGNVPSSINMPMGLTKSGTSLFFTAGNGVAKVSAVP